MRFLEGEQAPFRTAAERKRLVGKVIRYLRSCDIDRSGRGYFFPRVDIVVSAAGLNLFLENGSTIHRGELREVVVLRDAEGEKGERDMRASGPERPARGIRQV